MKKIFFILPLILVFAIPVSAKNETNAQGTTSQTQQQLRVSPSPIGTGVQNQNQVGTKNQGEDSQLKVSTWEQESLDNESLSDQVHQLLQLRTTGGIGEQVRQIAQEQIQVQDQIKTEISKVEGRGNFAKFLIGPDYKGLKNMQMLMEQNQLRIQQLEQLKTQLVNQGDITLIQETIQMLTDQNVSLQDKIALEEKSTGLFGWLIKLFVK